MEERNDIVIYKSEDGLVKMEAMVDPANETIWANQKAIAALFGVTVPNISYHLGRIFIQDYRSQYHSLSTLVMVK